MNNILPASNRSSQRIKTIILNLFIFISGLSLLADTQTATVNFNTVIETNNALTWSMDEGGYGQGGTDITVEPEQRTNVVNLHVAMMRLDLGYSTPGDANSTIICQATGASTNITGDQWVDAVKAVGAVPEISVQMNSSISQSTWVIDASNMVKHFNITSTTNRVARWIIGNEPTDNGLTTSTYSSGFEAIFPMMKAVDSTIKVGGPADATYDTSTSGEIKTILTNIKNAGLTPDFVDYHSYGDHPDSDAALMAMTEGQYQGDPQDLRSFLVSTWGSSVGGAMPIQIGEWNLSGTADSRMLENYGSVWAASAVGNMLVGGVSVMQQYADKNGILGAMCETADENATAPSSETYNGNINDPEPIYHGIGMFTGENLFQEFGSNVVKCTSSTTNIEVYASANPQNIVAINKTSGTTSSVTFTLTGLSSGTLAVWQKNSGGNDGNYSTNVPVDLGTVTVSSGSFSYSLPAYSVTTFVYTNAGSTPPTIISQPQSQTKNVGDPVTFSVAAIGALPMSCQWQFNGANISGATSSSYTNNNVQTSNAGDYDVVVTNKYGSVTSSTAVLTVDSTGFPLPSLSLNFSTANQYLTNFYYSSNSPCVWTNTGGVTNGPALLVTNGDSDATYTNSYWDFSTNTAWVNVSMMIQIQQATSTGDKIQLGLVNPSNAGLAGVTAGDGWNLGSFRLLPQSTTALTYQLEYQTAADGTTEDADVGSVITLTAGHWYQFNTYFTNTGPGNSYNIACSLIDYGTTGSTQGANIFTFSTLQAVTTSQAALSSDIAVYPCFRLADDTGVTMIGNFSVNSSNGGILSPPSITTQPQSQTVNQGNNVTFSVTATGTAPLSYQWQFNGANISSATSSSYTIDDVQSANAGNYDVVVTNILGSVTSSTAVLTVDVPPTITTQPQSQAVNQGNNVTFSVTATGTAPLSYQWQFNSANISGATSSSYTLDDVQSANAGNYDVVITNIAGSVTSSTAVLTVDSPPSITTQPQSQAVNQGNNVTFSVTATGTAPLSYQWQFNSANISGATSSSYTLDDVQSANAGNYDVVITNNYGSVTSSTAVLTVNTNTSGGGTPNLMLNFNTPNQYLTNFDNPGTGSACAETNAGGVGNSGAILATNADSNATYTNGSWDFSTNSAWVNVSEMVLIGKQATSTADKIQLGLVNSTTAGFADAAAGDGWTFGSFRLVPSSTTSPSYQLACQTATNGTASTTNIGSAVTLTVGHWYQFTTYLTNTGPGLSYNIAASLVDYGTGGTNAASTIIASSSTLQSITGVQAALSSVNTVYPGFRVADDTGVTTMDNFSLNSSNYTSPPPPPAQTLWLNFDVSNEYLTNFDNPGTGGSPCTETNAGGVTNSGALLVTGGDSNCTYTNGSWNFSTNNAAISVSEMLKIQQATGTGDKIQLGLVNSNNAGFANAAAGDGWTFGSFRLLPQSTTALTYQLGYQTATNGTTSSANVGSVVTLTSGHWYQFSTYFTNTGPGTSYSIASSLIDYGTTGATQGTNMFTFSTVQSITGAQALFSSDATVWPCFRVADDTGVSVVDDFAVNISSSAGLPMVMSPSLPGGSAAPQFGTRTLSNGQLTLTWTAGSSSSQAAQASPVTLLSATNLAGPWIAVTNAASPYTVPVNSGVQQQFFRLEQQ